MSEGQRKKYSWKRDFVVMVVILGSALPFYVMLIAAERAKLPQGMWAAGGGASLVAAPLVRWGASYIYGGYASAPKWVHTFTVCAVLFFVFVSGLTFGAALAWHILYHPEPEPLPMGDFACALLRTGVSPQTG